jgi:hypothetical protein
MIFMKNEKRQMGAFFAWRPKKISETKTIDIICRQADDNRVAPPSSKLVN